MDVADFLWKVIFNVIIGARQATVVDQQLIMNISFHHDFFFFFCKDMYSNIYETVKFNCCWSW